MVIWLQGLCGGQAAAVKMYNLKQHGAAAVYETEKLAYQALEALQGGTIPRLLRSGLMEHTATLSMYGRAQLCNRHFCDAKVCHVWVCSPQLVPACTGLCEAGRRHDLLAELFTTGTPQL